MSDKTQVTKKAAQQAKRIRKAVSDNLIELDDNTATRPNPGELNQKIGRIDADLDSLRTTLKSTNQGLMDSLTHLNEKDTDLRSKVTEAYQQLGALDSAYRQLTSQSSEISREIKAVAKQVREVSQKSDEQFGNLGEEYQGVVARIEDLSAKSKQTTQDLNKSIKANANAMLELEKNLLTEIDDLANRSRERDESLDQKTQVLAEGLDKADAEIRASQARLLKMQAIDQALEKRADALEATTDELTRKSRELSRSTTTLFNRTQELSEAIVELKATTEEHSGQIADLQEHGEKTANALFALILREKHHFRLLGVSLLVLLALIVGYLYYNQTSWQEEASANAELQSGIASLGNDLALTDSQVAQAENDLAELKQQTQQADNVRQEEIAAINRQLTTIGDQVDSLDGRVTNLRPTRTFGNGNTIHGPEWVAAQPAGNYTIHLATVGDQQELYALAERYSHYLKDELAYLPVQFRGVQHYALLYGQFAGEGEATSALSLMPRTIERSRPTVQPMSRIQAYNNKGSE